jgi:hypothetical protein
VCSLTTFRLASGLVRPAGGTSALSKRNNELRPTAAIDQGLSFLTRTILKPVWLVDLVRYVYRSMQTREEPPSDRHQERERGPFQILHAEHPSSYPKIEEKQLPRNSGCQGVKGVCSRDAKEVAWGIMPSPFSPSGAI